LVAFPTTAGSRHRADARRAVGSGPDGVVKASTLRTMFRQAGIDRDDFLAAYEQS
jgi:hypothetical protein